MRSMTEGPAWKKSWGVEVWYVLSLRNLYGLTRVEDERWVGQKAGLKGWLGPEGQDVG